MQKITIVGNLGRDPEERVTPKGNKLVSFSLAVSPKKDITVWYDCTIWEKRLPMFEGILKHIKKGSKIIVMGDFAVPETYQDSNGNVRVKLRVEPFSISFAGSSQNNEEAKKPEHFQEVQKQEQFQDLPF